MSKNKSYTVTQVISGTRNGVDWPKPGGTIELPDDEALDYLNAGYVRPLATSTPEVSTPAPAEIAAPPAVAATPADIPTTDDVTAGDSAPTPTDDTSSAKVPEAKPAGAPRVRPAAK